MCKLTYLIEAMERLKKEKKYDMVYDLLLPAVDEGRVYGYGFNGYWKDIGTIKSYYQTNLALVSPDTQLPLYDEDWKLLTPSEDRAPALMSANAKIKNSLIPNGCRIDGTVVDSVLFPGCVVKEGAYVSSSILLNDTIIEKGAKVEMAILDKNVTVGQNATIGFGEDYTVNKELPEQLNDGLTIIGKGARIPDETQIGHNCKLDPGIGPEDFSGKAVQAGTSLTTNDFRYIY